MIHTFHSCSNHPPNSQKADTQGSSPHQASQVPIVRARPRLFACLCQYHKSGIATSSDKAHKPDEQITIDITLHSAEVLLWPFSPEMPGPHPMQPIRLQACCSAKFW